MVVNSYPSLVMDYVDCRKNVYGDVILRVDGPHAWESDQGIYERWEIISTSIYGSLVHREIVVDENGAELEQHATYIDAEIIDLHNQVRRERE